MRIFLAICCVLGVTIGMAITAFLLAHLRCILDDIEDKFRYKSYNLKMKWKSIKISKFINKDTIAAGIVVLMVIFFSSIFIFTFL